MAMSIRRGFLNGVALEALIFFALWAVWVWAAGS